MNAPLRLVSSLPSPHDPGERTRVAWVGLWEVRQFPDGDARLAYFRPRGFHHLQLWNPAARISILTPSRLTAGMFEVWPERGERSSAATWRQVTEQLSGIAMPSALENLRAGELVHRARRAAHAAPPAHLVATRAERAPCCPTA